MSPTQFNEQQHAKRETTLNGLGSSSPSPLKINKTSQLIKKTSPSSSSSSPSPLIKPQQRHPVIIYTHSPKIIHTHPRDFIALVQKLTGLSRNEDDQKPPQAKVEKGGEVLLKEDSKNMKGIINDDNSSSSVITDENCGSIGDGGQVNSCFLPPVFDPPNHFLSNIPFFTSNSTDFLCSNQPFYNYTDSLFFAPPNLRSSNISSSTLEAMNEFHEY